LCREQRKEKEKGGRIAERGEKIESHFGCVELKKGLGESREKGRGKGKGSGEGSGKGERIGERVGERVGSTDNKESRAARIIGAQKSRKVKRVWGGIEADCEG